MIVENLTAQSGELVSIRIAVHLRAVKSDCVGLGSKVLLTQYFRKVTAVTELFLRMK